MAILQHYCFKSFHTIDFDFLFSFTYFLSGNTTGTCDLIYNLHNFIYQLKFCIYMCIMIYIINKENKKRKKATYNEHLQFLCRFYKAFHFQVHNMKI